MGCHEHVQRVCSTKGAVSRGGVRFHTDRVIVLPTRRLLLPARIDEEIGPVAIPAGPSHHPPPHDRTVAAAVAVRRLVVGRHRDWAQSTRGVHYLRDPCVRPGWERQRGAQSRGERTERLAQAQRNIASMGVQHVPSAEVRDVAMATSRSLPSPESPPRFVPKMKAQGRHKSAAGLTPWKRGREWRREGWMDGWMEGGREGGREGRRMRPSCRG